MWTKTENGESIRPASIESSGGMVILRKNFKLVPETSDAPSHYEYEEWQMKREEYEIFQYYETLVGEQSDALMELAELITEVSG